TQRSDLCASCHTIVLPIYDANGNPVMEGGVPKTDFEQTTYLEWVNSAFSKAPAKQCQDCHMPGTFRGAKMEFKVANIEDTTFPRFRSTDGSTTLPADEIDVQSRTDYPRHLLNGINLFALEMFDQFRTDLGLYQFDSWLPVSIATKVNSQKIAVEGGVNLA